ncbi:MULTISPECIES: hypothetical protein [Microbacterium]|uniref:hypothetical protein n=1 Tax=Microbacterium TaxID=33882 RepID=UPI00278463D7|nr:MULTISPECIES: hypothetical protein [Microbacterium]MDQ1083988.1 hypothetical protein [Microbacterium sp. SORGH_AS_0344]MDQ1170732.1 hypothetical protein [Microbacterium proteolyticum]
MNALFTRAPQHSSAAPTTPTPSTVTFDTTAYRPLGPLDRLSLRIGLWLLTRHADRARALDHEAVAAHRARQAAEEREKRERAWQSTAAFSRLPF